MKKILTLILALNFGLSLGQTTTIPDPNFEQALIDLGYDTGTPDGSVPTANISSPWYLDVSMKNISDLTGIADFTALITLNCYSNQLTNLDVTQNTNLMNLNCSNNQILSLDLSQNNNMSNLNCDSNQLTSLDMSFAVISDFQTLTSIGNPNLNCIKVTDSVFSTNSWAHNIDTQHYFSNNCSSTSTSIFEDRPQTEKVTIYPNPMKSSATIELPKDQESYCLFIYDVLGNVVRTVENISSKNLMLEKRDLTNGVYLYQLSSTNNSYSGKFIVE